MTIYFDFSWDFSQPRLFSSFDCFDVTGISGSYDVVHAKPVFAVGGTVSGYGSMGSSESLHGDNKPVTVWSDNSDTNKTTPIMTQELRSINQAKSSFKSEFAKQLNCKVGGQQQFNKT